MYPIARPHLPVKRLVSLLQFWLYKKKTIKTFEGAAASFFKRKYAVSYSSGRVALQQLFEALGITGKNIAVPSYTCIVVPYAIELAGNTPVFVEPQDIHRFVPTTAELAQHADVVVQTHMFGRVLDAGVGGANTLVIEDACLAVGSSIGGKPAGTLGDVSLFSFNKSKQLSCVGGGILVTDDEAIYHALIQSQRYTSHWWDEVMHVAKVFLLALYYKKPVYSFFKAIRFSSATATDFSLASCTLDTEYQKGFLASQAILGLGQLKDASTILTKRRIIADWYDTELRGVSGIRIPDIHPDTELSHYWVVLKKDRQDVRKKLYAQGINTGIANEYSCPTTPHYAPQHDAALFTGTTDIGDSIINLPYYIGLTKKDVVRICTIFKQVYGESR